MCLGVTLQHITVGALVAPPPFASPQVVIMFVPRFSWHHTSAIHSLTPCTSDASSLVPLSLIAHARKLSLVVVTMSSDDEETFGFGLIEDDAGDANLIGGSRHPLVLHTYPHHPIYHLLF